MMASQQGFTFPPPPPPPPAQPSTQQFSQTFGNVGPNASNNAFAHRGGYRSGSGGSGFRGRGRGGMNRGGRGGGAHHANNYRNTNNQGMYGGGGYAQGPSNASQYYQNSSLPSQIYPSTTQRFSGQTHAAPSTTYPPRSYDAGHRNTTKGPSRSSTQSYPVQSSISGNNAIPNQTQSNSSPVGTSTVMAPPMHWGYDRTGAGGFYPGSTNGASFKSIPHPSTSHGSQHGGFNNQHKGGQKRAFSSAFEKPAPQAPQVIAPPAVPSFGVPLPAKPPQPTDTPRKVLKKKKRKFNQLGLTPKTEEHESSEEEDDVDEESRLALSAGNTGSGPLQITFRGRTSTLSTAADFQLWMEERKKRFPTQARVEEKKKAYEETKKQRELQREEARRKQLELKEQKAQARKDSKEQKETESNPMNAALKAKAKAEKLRKKLLKEERRLQKAEADAERARLVAEASQQQSTERTMQEDVDQSVVESSVDNATQKSTTEATVSVPENGDIEEGSLSNITDSSDNDSVSDDSDEDDDDGDDAPEEMSSRREGPERVPPPPRQGPKRSDKPCRAFQQRGKCPRGRRCRYSHDLSADGVRQPLSMKPGEGMRQPPAKRGLFQMLVAQEIQQRDRQVMQAISRLGSQGLLEEVETGFDMKESLGNDPGGTIAVSDTPGDGGGHTT